MDRRGGLAVMPGGRRSDALPPAFAARLCRAAGGEDAPSAQGGAALHPSFVFVLLLLLDTMRAMEGVPGEGSLVDECWIIGHLIPPQLRAIEFDGMKN